MRRAAIERLRTIALHRRYYQQQSPRFGNSQRKWAEKLPVNLFRKTHRIGGCFQSRCFLCHAEKLLGFKTLWERRADDAERDGWIE